MFKDEMIITCSYKVLTTEEQPYLDKKYLNSYVYGSDASDLVDSGNTYLIEC